MADDLQSKATEMMKKVLTVGVGTFFMTEEALRSMVADFKLPKEMIGNLLDSAGRSRKEFMEKLSSDVIGRIKEGVDFRELIEEYLDRHEINFDVTVSFTPKDKTKKTPKKPKVETA